MTPKVAAELYWFGPLDPPEMAEVRRRVVGRTIVSVEVGPVDSPPLTLVLDDGSRVSIDAAGYEADGVTIRVQ